MIDIGHNISTLRQAAGLNQRELAKRLHVSAPAVCQWESGNRGVSVSQLAEIADALQVPRSVLLVERGTKPVGLNKFQSEEWDYLQSLFVQVVGTLILRQK